MSGLGPGQTLLDMVTTCYTWIGANCSLTYTDSDKTKPNTHKQHEKLSKLKTQTMVMLLIHVS